ncbi:hypothetical protein Tsubulata_016772 [Turnera subulata]|uniref:Uncharacterized protein n=1 Tax=Turnera subulata TaxID=218843 RepID=A0A9Q0F9E5_9ROSI|nr:hypothetical protein Tsubulata_016772 [Turnera subulata]
MSKGAVYQGRQQKGLGSSSQDYHAHISMLTKMVSFHPDLPQYPNVHKAFKNKTVEQEEQEQLQKKKSSKAKKKVQIDDQVIDNEGESIDDEASSFIRGKRRVFELCKWKTFKLQ